MSRDIFHQRNLPLGQLLRHATAGEPVGPSPHIQLALGRLLLLAAGEYQMSP
jgi:hypothetical protein